MIVNIELDWDSGGGILMDVITLSDGTVLAISDELIALYRDRDELVSGVALESFGRPADYYTE